MRRASLLAAMPSWADRAKIKAVYALAIETTRRTGRSHEVDHIVPLRGRNVCGLHVDYNLQVIPEAVNQVKSNKFCG